MCGCVSSGIVSPLDVIRAWITQGATISPDSILLKIDSMVTPFSKDTNPLYYDLIKEFYKITDVPVLINTSMNVRGEPIVNTLEQAYNMIIKTDMDYLVMGNYTIKKP